MLFATSRETNNRIVACSAAYDLFEGRRLCQDRIPFFYHFKPRPFLKNAVRISLVQCTTVVSNFYNDQMRLELDRDVRVRNHEITNQQADEEDREWQEKEWPRRTKAIVQKIAIAFTKYHAITFLMRVYESMADAYVVNKETLDKLTTDPFAYAQRQADRGVQGPELVRTAFPAILSANIIYYAADLSVHQIILSYGFYVYVKRKRQQSNNNNEKAVVPAAAPLAFTFLKKSTLLAFTRCLGLVLSSGIGAVGTMVWPGWGTLCGINAGDSLAFAIDGNDSSALIE